MAEIQIIMLGQFEVRVDGTPIEERFDKSRKSKLLLQYLLLNRRSAISYRRLYDLLWPSEESTNPENALKTLVSRLRSSLARSSDRLAECILTSAGTYQWNPAIDVELDIDAFEECASALLAEQSMTPEARAQGARLLTLYAGDLLPSSEQIGWMVATSLRLHGLYLKAIYHYLKLLRQAGDMGEVIEACRAGLAVDALDERLRVELMDALVRARRADEAMAQYALAPDLHYERLGVHLPEGIVTLYRGIVHSGELLEMSIDAIAGELHASDQVSGAFVCPYDVFQSILQLQLRNLGQSSATIALVLIRLCDTQGQALEPSAMDALMDGLVLVLRKNLRRGDTIARYGASQCALLLPMVTYATGNLVMNRVRRAFYEDLAAPSVLLSYRVRPLSARPSTAPDGSERRAALPSGAE